MVDEAAKVQFFLDVRGHSEMTIGDHLHTIGFFCTFAPVKMDKNQTLLNIRRKK